MPPKLNVGRLFEEELQLLTEQNIIVTGDFDAYVGSERQGYENIIGVEGWGIRNEEGERLLDEITGRLYYIYYWETERSVVDIVHTI